MIPRGKTEPEFSGEAWMAMMRDHKSADSRLVLALDSQNGICG